MRKPLLIATAVIGIAFAAALPVTEVSFAQQSENDTGSGEMTRSQVEGIVRDYLLANPEILFEMQTRLEEQQRMERQAAAQQEIQAASDDIFTNPNDAVLGNPNGDVTIVEFFDYNCGYCKRGLSDMQTLVRQNGDLRFVLKEFPILGPDSQDAHMVSMALRKLAPEKYSEFHERLLGSEGRATEESAINLAVDLGVDEEDLRETMRSSEIAETINKTYELANRLQITGTPSYVIGDEVLSGAVGEAVLNEKIEEIRP